jgi:23S rRNA-/tRNA-specific pseudouridylate synthase
MEQGVIDVPIAVNPDNPVTRKADAGGKPAQTAWRVRKRFDQYTLVEAELLTGAPIRFGAPGLDRTPAAG